MIVWLLIHVFSDCLDGNHFLAGEVLLHAINSHLGKYGDGGCTLGQLDQISIMKFMLIYRT